MMEMTEMFNLGTFDEMISDMESGIWDYTVDGKCSGCGSCCSDLLPMSEREVRQIRAYITKNRIKEQKHFVPTALPVTDFICPFRNNTEKRCEIYEVRPAICRDFKCDKPKQGVWANQELYQEEVDIVSVRETFFGKEEKR